MALALETSLQGKLCLNPRGIVRSADLISAMPLLFPTQSTLYDIFARQSPVVRRSENSRPQSAPYHAPKSLFPAWSAVDDMKSKAGQLSAEAQRELQKASQTVQGKTGKLELYSLQYYAACTLGGLLACVRLSGPDRVEKVLNRYRVLHIRL